MKTKTKINKVLIYKRTHPNDPRKEGVFGVENCLRSRRNAKFDVVIGIGGVTQTDKSFKDMAKKINWVGVGVTNKISSNVLAKHHVTEPNGTPYSAVMVFEHFALYESVQGKSYSCNGESIPEKYPALYKFAYEKSNNKKQVWSQRAPWIYLDDPKLCPKLKAEIEAIIDKAIANDPNSAHVLSPAGIIHECKKVSKVSKKSCGGGCPPTQCGSC